MVPYIFVQVAHYEEKSQKTSFSKLEQNVTDKCGYTLKSGLCVLTCCIGICDQRGE